MSAKKDFYLAIRAKLEATSVKHARLFNNQYNKIAQEKPFPFPAAFIQFLELDYTTRGDKSQDAETIVRLHVGYDSIKTEDLAVFDLLEEIHQVLQGLELSDDFTPLDRVHEEQDVDHDVISVWLVDYSFKLRDRSAARENTLIKTQLQDVGIEINAAKPWLRQSQ